jgi:SAM-dependent methyltransferase
MQPRDASRVFGEVVDVYDRVRLPYPDELIDDVLGYSQILDGHGMGGWGRALEVGAGSGRATVAFAARGVPVVAVEPDDAMADALARRAAEFPGIDVVRSSFEDFRPAERFGLLFSAEAWHWTAPKTRWSLAAQALAEDAALALFWHNERIDQPELRAAMLRVYAEHLPSVEIRDEPVGPAQVWRQWPGDQLAGIGAFGNLASRHYRRRQAMTGVDYLGLTQTRSHFRMLSPSTRSTVLAALTEVFGDEVPLVIDTTLLLARRQPYPRM